MKGSVLQPIGKTKRIQYLDVLRGIAILFIFIANLISFSGWFILSEPEQGHFSFPALNKAISFIIQVFIDGKWYSVFSILFGIGFAIQLNRAVSKGLNFPNFFMKRMFGLLLIGLVHLFFWIGDILTLYALLGMVLILFRNLSNRALLIWASLLMLAPIAHTYLAEIKYAPPYFRHLFIYLDQLWVNAGFELRDWQGMGRATTDPLYHFQTESLTEFLRINVFLPILRLAMLVAEGRFFKVLACFLIGLVAGRQIIKHGLLTRKKFLTRLAIVGFVVGFTANLTMYFVRQSSSLDNAYFIWVILYAIGVIPMALFYCSGLALLYQLKRSVFTVFAAVGKLALTNYLAQTLVSVLFFYGIGLGFAIQLALWQVMLFGITFFCLQAWLSTIYLQYKKQGPLEWFWRKLTYGKALNWRKT